MEVMDKKFVIVGHFRHLSAIHHQMSPGASGSAILLEFWHFDFLWQIMMCACKERIHEH